MQARCESGNTVSKQKGLRRQGRFLSEIAELFRLLHQQLHARQMNHVVQRGLLCRAPCSSYTLASSVAATAALFPFPWRLSGSSLGEPKRKQTSCSVALHCRPGAFLVCRRGSSRPIHTSEVWVSDAMAFTKALRSHARSDSGRLHRVDAFLFERYFTRRGLRRTSMLWKTGRGVPGRALFTRREQEGSAARPAVLTKADQLCSEWIALERGVRWKATASRAARAGIANWPGEPERNWGCGNCSRQSNVRVAGFKPRSDRTFLRAPSKCPLGVCLPAGDGRGARGRGILCAATHLFSCASPGTGSDAFCCVKRHEPRQVVRDPAVQKACREETAAVGSCSSSKLREYGPAYGSQRRPALSAVGSRINCKSYSERLLYGSPGQSSHTAPSANCGGTRSYSVVLRSSHPLPESRLIPVDLPSLEESLTEVLLLNGSDFDSRMGGSTGAWQWFEWLSSQQEKLFRPCRSVLWNAEATRNRLDGQTDSSCARPSTRTVLEQTDSASPPRCGGGRAMSAERAHGIGVNYDDLGRFLERPRGRCWQQEDLLDCAEQIGQNVLRLSSFLWRDSACCRLNQQRVTAASRVTSSVSPDSAAAACSRELQEVSGDGHRLRASLVPSDSWGSPKVAMMTDSSLGPVSSFTALLRCSLRERPDDGVVFELTQGTTPSSCACHAGVSRGRSQKSAYPSSGPSTESHTLSSDNFLIPSQETRPETNLPAKEDVPGDDSLCSGARPGDYSRLLLPIIHQKPRCSTRAYHGSEAEVEAIASDTISPKGVVRSNDEEEKDFRTSPLIVFCYPVFSSLASDRRLFPFLRDRREKLQSRSFKRKGRQDRHLTPDDSSRGMVPASVQTPAGLPGSLASSSYVAPSSSSDPYACASGPFLTPILSRLSCLSPVDCLSLLFAFTAIPAGLSGTPAPCSHFPLVKQEISGNKRSLNQHVSHGGSADLAGIGESDDAEGIFQAVVQRLIRRLLPSLEHLRASIHLDVLSSCIRLSRLVDALDSPQRAKRKDGGSPCHSRRSEQRCPANESALNDEIFLVASSFLPKLLEATASSHPAQLDCFERRPLQGALYRGYDTTGPATRGTGSGNSSQVDEAEARPDCWWETKSRSSGCAEVPVSLEAVVNFICIANAGRGRRLPEHLSEVVTRLTDYCCRSRELRCGYARWRRAV